VLVGCAKLRPSPWRPSTSSRAWSRMNPHDAPTGYSSATVNRPAFAIPIRTLDNFDFTFNAKSIGAWCSIWPVVLSINKREDALFLGPGGAGKSHLTQAIGQAAIMQGYGVLYRETHVLLDELGRRRRRRHSQGIHGVDLHLLVVDDFGMRKLPHTPRAEDVPEIIMRRYERCSTLLTYNRPVEDWGTLLGYVAAASAMLSRAAASGPRAQVRPPRSWRTKTRLYRKEEISVHCEGAAFALPRFIAFRQDSWAKKVRWNGDSPFWNPGL
jgi:DNA replication protein DnaC